MTVEENSIVTIQNSVINKAIDFIFDNIDNEITVDDVARHCSYSKYHLMRMFKEQGSISFLFLLKNFQSKNFSALSQHIHSFFLLLKIILDVPSEAYTLHFYLQSNRSPLLAPYIADKNHLLCDLDHSKNYFSE